MWKNLVRLESLPEMHKFTSPPGPDWRLKGKKTEK